MYHCLCNEPYLSLLMVQTPDTECFEFSFAFNGVNIWNGIDFDVRNAPNVQSFKTRYKHFKKYLSVLVYSMCNFSFCIIFICSIFVMQGSCKTSFG